MWYFNPAEPHVSFSGSQSSAHYDISGDDDEGECEGPFHFMLSIVMFKINIS